MTTRAKNWILRPYFDSAHWIEGESTVLVTDTFCVLTSLFQLLFDRYNQWSGGTAAHPAPKNSECKNLLEKFLPASILWDQERIILIDYLPKGQTINVEYHSSLLVQLKDILKEKCHGKVTKGVLFLHDNVPVLATQKKLAYLGFHCLDHPPYSPDLAPSDYHMFPGLKKQLEGCHFSSDVEVIAATETWLDRQPEFFLSGLWKLEQGAKKGIELHGECVE